MADIKAIAVISIVLVAAAATVYIINNQTYNETKSQPQNSKEIPSGKSRC